MTLPKHNEDQVSYYLYVNIMIRKIYKQGYSKLHTIDERMLIVRQNLLVLRTGIDLSVSDH